MERNVGADFFTAAELAALELPGLPRRREHISRLASRPPKWPHRERQGKGGGREFPLSALPAEARAEILRRRVHEGASNDGRPHAPMPTLDALTDRQATRLAARSVLLQAFDRMRGPRSERATLDPFVVTFERGELGLPPWITGEITTLSAKTLKRWLAARRKGDDEALAGRWAGGRQSTFDRSIPCAEFVLGLHAKQPHLSVASIAARLADAFPEGVPDERGVVMDHPSQGAIARFLSEWRADARNALALTSLNDPDRYKSKFRFSGGDASAGIERLNQLWQIDASPADVLCSDGRHSIYVVIDVFTRRVMALVSRNPKTESSLLLVARACNAWGVPEIIATDNGSDFTSKHFVLALRQLGVHHKLAPPFSPEKKPFVERVIGTIQHSFMPLIDGYIGHDVAARQQIRARKTFAERLGESDQGAGAVPVGSGDLQDMLVAWLDNDYANRPHGGLDGRTPAEATAQAIALTPPRMAKPEAIGMLLMPPAFGGGSRTVTKKAVAVDGIDYWCDDLVIGQRIHVRKDPADLGVVYFYTATDPWHFIGIGRNPEFANLDRAEMSARLRAAQDKVVREGRAQLRELARKITPATFGRGLRDQAEASAAGFTHTTPALEEAARAVAGPAKMPAIEAPIDADAQRAFVADLAQRRQKKSAEEQPADRYARWKSYRALIEQAAEISADSAAWVEAYETTSEWRSFRLIDEARARQETPDGC